MSLFLASLPSWDGEKSEPRTDKEKGSWKSIAKGQTITYSNYSESNSFHGHFQWSTVIVFYSESIVNLRVITRKLIYSYTMVITTIVTLW
jgi:hypothetical protein